MPTAVFKQYFEDCQVGDRVQTSGRTITESDVILFAAFSGDWNPVHTDREFAAAHTPFGERVAHGLLGLVVGTCLLSRVGWFTFLPEHMISLTAVDRVRFVRPIRLQDTIYLEAEIVDMTPMSNDVGSITTLLKIRNQRKELVIIGRMTVLTARRPSEHSQAEPEVHRDE